MGERTCATMAVHERLLATDPYYERNLAVLERFTTRFVRAAQRAGLRTGVVTIPVVVHVVWHTQQENISDAQIQSQIAVLNRDFRRTNSDIGSTPAVFQPFTADCRIQFALARRDAQCGPTTGITRTQTTVTSFSSNDAVKSASSGGHDAWPADRYLNLWVCKLMGGLLGYAQFPGGPGNTDGVVCTYTAFGTMGTAAAPFHLGRTATHEIGHWLNLLHIWGDAAGCAVDDGVADTPLQYDLHTDCPTFPQISCNNGPNGDMFMNYMDYTDDACMYMFTAGQAARMDACLAGARAGLLASDALIPPPSIAAADLWMQDTPEDQGDEPNNVSTAFYVSDDIWVRRQNDGLTTQDHENPIYRPAGPPNYVYVRVRNRSCATADSGTLKLYWAKASSALGWPKPWDASVTSPALMGEPIGSQPTGSVPARGSVILTFPWNPPNPADYASFGAGKAHFCLLARIETAAAPPYGMTTPEGNDLWQNVKNNNNIVWKNITVAEPGGGGSKVGSVVVGKLLRGDWQMKVVFIVPHEKIVGEPLPNLPRHLLEWGRVEVTLGAQLYARWKEAGFRGRGVEAASRYRAVIREPEASIGPLRVEAGELFTITARFIPRDRVRRPSNEVFTLHLVQYAVARTGERPIGGQAFVVKVIGPTKA